jgi:hypothetical protein
MTANITFNPVITTNALGSFNVLTDGFIQGFALDSPAVRYGLAGGVLATTETLPMWGGIPIVESIPTPATANPRHELGGIITRATALSSAGGLTGWSVFDQQYAAINSPQSPVPLVGTGGQVNFYRTGSGARIPVACDPGLVSLEGSSINKATTWSWNFNGGFLQAYDASTPTYSVTSLTYATTNGGQIAVVMAVPDPLVTQVGDIINISGATTGGTGGNNAVNGNFIVNTWTSTSAFTVSATNAGGAAYYGTIAGTIVLNEGTGDASATPVFLRVLEIAVGNSFTVGYNLATGFATWNQIGSTAIILV